MVATKSPELQKAVTIVKYLSADEQTRWEYEAREKALRDEQWRLNSSYRKGRIEGQIEGERKKALEIAKNLIALGLTPDVAAKGSGLSLDEIEKL